MLSINKNFKIKNELRHEPKKKERKKVKYYNRVMAAKNF